MDQLLSERTKCKMDTSQVRPSEDGITNEVLERKLNEIQTNLDHKLCDCLSLTLTKVANCECFEKHNVCDVSS